MQVIIDSREQKPYTFAKYPEVKTTVAALPVGDYTIQGFEQYISIERKSLSDLVQSLGRERERFFRELQRARGLRFCVVVEGTWASLAAGRYPSRLHPHAAVARVAAIMSRLGIPVLFCGSRAAGETATYQLLHQFLEEERRRYRAVAASSGGCVASGASASPSVTAAAGQ